MVLASAGARYGRNPGDLAVSLRILIQPLPPKSMHSFHRRLVPCRSPCSVDLCDPTVFVFGLTVLNVLQCLPEL